MGRQEMSPPSTPRERTSLRRTYRYRIYPTAAQVTVLKAQLGGACDLYNAALEHRKRMWRDHGKSVSYYDQSAELKDLRACGLIVPKALDVRVHSCACGYTADRDVNAARNVLAKALRRDAPIRRQRWGEEARAVA